MRQKLCFFCLLFSLIISAQQNSPLGTNSGLSNIATCAATPTPGDFVANGGFEQYSSVPTTLDQMSKACGWASPTITSPDYFHANGGNSVSIPNNFAGTQTVSSTHGGEAYAGIAISGGYREMIRTKLTQPLQPNTEYQITFEVSLGETWTSNLIKFQAFIGSYIQSPVGGDLPIQQDPNGILLNDDIFHTNTNGWDLITLNFTTGNIGGQEYLYIGAINNPQISGSPLGYYYIDNVSLKLPPEDCECGELKPNILYSINNCGLTAVPIVSSCPNLSQISYNWVFSNGNVYSGQFPPEQYFAGPNGGFNQMTLTITYQLDGSYELCQETVTKSFFIPCRSKRTLETTLVLHPNPAKDVLNILISDTTIKNGSIELVNSFGVTISKTKHEITKNNTAFSFDVSKLSTGIYFVKFINENGITEIKRFVKM